MDPQHQQLIPNPARFRSTVIFVVMIALCVLAAVLNPDKPLYPLVVVAVALTVFGVRALRSGIVIGSDGIVGRGEYRTLSLRWAEIEKFVVTTNLFGDAITAHRPDGNTVRLMGYAYTKGLTAKGAVGILEREREQHA